MGVFEYISYNNQIRVFELYLLTIRWECSKYNSYSPPADQSCSIHSVRIMKSKRTCKFRPTGRNTDRIE